MHSKRCHRGRSCDEWNGGAGTERLVGYEENSLSGRMFAANLTLATGRQDLRASLASSDVDRMKD